MLPEGIPLILGCRRLALRSPASVAFADTNSAETLASLRRLMIVHCLAKSMEKLIN